MRYALLLSLVGALACGERAEPGRDSERAAAEPAVSAATDLPVVLFLGTSLTAGLGLSESEAYPGLIQQKMDSAGLRFRVINAGESGGTSAGGLRRIDWLLQQPVSVLVLELGANDALRGQDLDATRRDLQEIMDRTRAAYPEVDIVIAGMQAPPNLGERYTTEFRSIFPELARRNNAALVPFLLEGVAAVRELNQADGIHPTAAGQRRLADNVWKVLEPVLIPVERRKG
ncbi:MAG: arylesterase [Gemmatimonadetes bacterium]|nr:arylesterase [Gemmatimonadota bacterium]MBI2614772.1 arylesterase [Gemmatimonadota bacterium]